MSKPNLLDVFFASKFGNPAMGAMLMRKDWLTATMADSVFGGTLKTVTGNPISVSDALAKAVESLTVGFSPVQDLNGYSNPWPGGGGKNLSSVESYSGSPRGFWGTSLAEVVEMLNTLPAGTYTISQTYTIVNLGSLTSVQSQGFLIQANGASITTTRTANTDDSPSVGKTYRSSTVFTIAEEDVGNITACYAYFGSPNYGTFTGTITEIQIEEGSSATSYAPYSNICPISGWQSVGVTKAGKNLLGEDWEVGGLSGSTGEAVSDSTKIRTASYYACMPNTDFYLYCGAGNNMMNVFWYDANKNYISASTVRNAVVTSPANARFMRGRSETAYGTTYLHDTAVLYPSTATTYEPYTGDSRTISLPSTIYGGSVDVVTGQGTVTHGIVDLGSLTWVASGYRSNSFITGGLVNNKSSINNAISTQYVITDKAFADMTNGTMRGTANNQSLWVVVDERYDNATAFKTAMSGVYLCYELATPTTISLDPQSLTMLQGDNTLWTDADSLTMQYKAKA